MTAATSTQGPVGLVRDKESGVAWETASFPLRGFDREEDDDAALQSPGVGCTPSPYGWKAENHLTLASAEQAVWEDIKMLTG